MDEFLFCALTLVFIAAVGAIATGLWVFVGYLVWSLV